MTYRFQAIKEIIMEKNMINLSRYKTMPLKNKLKRLIWNITWNIVTFFFPKSFGNYFKIVALRLFGAEVHKSSKIYSSAQIFQPWKLKIGANSTLSSGVDCYNVDWIVIGSNSTISQNTFLCTASHDIEDGHHQLITKPIHIGDQVWVGSRAFINMGVVLGEGSVIAGQALINKNVESWTVVGGNPARFIKERTIKYYSN